MDPSDRCEVEDRLAGVERPAAQGGTAKQVSHTSQAANGCPWCAVDSGKQHEDWCPCSASSRKFVRAQYRISTEAGLAAADRIRDAAETISGAGRV